MTLHRLHCRYIRKCNKFNEFNSCLYASQFQEQEKKRYTQEQQRFDIKHVKQLEELRATAEGTIR